MRRTWVVALAVAVLSTGLAAQSKNASKLATIRTVKVVPVDELGEDVGVAKCLAEHISEQTPVKVVTEGDVDAVLKVSAHLPSTTTKVLVGIMGGTPSAHLYVELPDGTKVWDDGAKFRASMAKQGQFGSSSADTGKSLQCGLADNLINTLRNAMKKARDKNQ